MVDQNTGAENTGTEAVYVARMRKLYDETIIKAMTDKFGYTHALQVPRIEKIEAPMHISKVAHVTADGKPTRVRFETQDGKKVRVAVKTGDKIDG